MLRGIYPFLLLATLVTAGNARLLDAMLPIVAAEFSISIGRSAIAITAYSVGYGLFQFVSGPLGDRLGPLRIMFGACVLATVAMVGTSLAHSLDGLAIGRAVTGAIAGAIIPLGMAWIADHTEGYDRQFKLAQLMSAAIFGAIFGQVIGGYVGGEVGWRAALLVMVVLYAVAACGLGASLFSVRNAATGQGSKLRKKWSTTFGDLIMLRDVRFVLACTAAEGAAIFGALAFIPAFLHKDFGLSAAQSGFLMAAFGAGGLCYVLVVKHLYAQFNRGSVALIGALACATGYVILSAHPALWVAALALAAAGFGSYMLHNVLQMLATMMAPRVRGTAIALFAACFFLAQSIGIAIGSSIVDRIGFEFLLVATAVLILITGVVISRAALPDIDGT